MTMNDYDDFLATNTCWGFLSSRTTISPLLFLYSHWCGHLGFLRILLPLISLFPFLQCFMSGVTRARLFCLGGGIWPGDYMHISGGQGNIVCFWMLLFVCGKFTLLSFSPVVFPALPSTLFIVRLPFGGFLTCLSLRVRRLLIPLPKNGLASVEAQAGRILDILLRRPALFFNLWFLKRWAFF